MMKAILTKPLDGQPEGTEREFTKADFERLSAMGAVRAADAPAEEPAPAPDTAEKAAPEPDNKMAEEPVNKAAPSTRRKRD